MSSFDSFGSVYMWVIQRAGFYLFLTLPSKALLNTYQINSRETNCKLLTISVSTMNESEEVVNKVFYDRTPFLRVVEGIP